MKRKLLLMVCALLGMLQAKAYTTGDLTSAGWACVTSLPTPLSDYYFVFVDNGGNLMMDYATGSSKQGTDKKTMYYRTNANPFTTPTMVWTLANNTAASGAYSIKNATEPTLYLQEESGESPWFCHTHDNGGGAGTDRDWCAYNIVYADSKWTIQTWRVREKTESYVGPWDDTIVNGAEVAGNKSGASIGYFQIYAIKRSEAPLDFTSKITNPSFESATDKEQTSMIGWTNSGMKTQNNTDFGKTDTYYVEAWQPSDTKSIKQTLSGLPAGLYCLSAHAKARGVTSAKIYAGNNETAITVEDKESDYLVYFTSDGSSNVEIGFEGVGTGAGSSWLAVDNFQLTTGTNVITAAVDMPSDGTVAANKWYKVFIPTAGNYDVTSTNAATIYYSQDGTTAANAGTSLSFAAAEKKSLPLSVGYLYIRSSAAQTLNVDTRFYLITTVNDKRKWLNKNASGYTYAYDKGLPFTLESNNDNVVLKFGEGDYLNDVGSSWQTKAEGSHNDEWTLQLADGGYKLLLGVDKTCQLFVANTTTGLVEITHSEDNGNVWQFIQPETALSYAIADAEARTLGFDDGEYAPYNYVTATTALATARAATTNDARISAYTALTDAANFGEVNAIAYGDLSSYETVDGKDYPWGWNKLNDGSRIMGGSEGSSNAGLSASSTGKAMLVKYDAKYGETANYTMPLKANTFYTLSFKYCGWVNTPETNVIVKDGSGTSLTLKETSFTPATSDGYSDETHWYNFTTTFRTNDAGNYTLELSKVDKTQQQIAWADMTLVRATSASEVKYFLNAEITAANATYNSGANVGTGVFQIPTGAGDTFNTAINTTAQGVYDDGSATCSDVITAFNNLKTAEETYAGATLNAPIAATRYYIKVATAGHAKLNNAIMLDKGETSDNNPTGYTLSANNNPAVYLTQAFIFTQVSGNTYNISTGHTDGTVYLTYGVTNGSTAGHKNYQIQATTDPSKKGEFEIVATNTANVFKIKNTIADAFIDCQDGGNIYTDGVITNEEFTLAEAPQASVTVSAKDGKCGTVIFPFTPDVSTGFDGITFYSINGINDATDRVQMNEVATPVANTPYLIKNTSGEDFSKAVTGWGVASQDSYDSGDTDIKLTGVYTAATIAASVAATADTDGAYRYVLQTKDATQAFYKVTADFTATAYKCYLTVKQDKTGGGVKAFFLDFGDADGIQAIDNGQLTIDNEKAEIYNLAGQKMNKLQKGVNIVNGKKLLVK